MHFVPGYSMMAATATTFMLSMIFLLLSGQSKKQYMRFWGLSWLVYSAMFLLDFCHLNWNFVYLGYVMLRQMLALLGSNVRQHWALLRSSRPFPWFFIQRSLRCIP